QQAKRFGIIGDRLVKRPVAGMRVAAEAVSQRFPPGQVGRQLDCLGELGDGPLRLVLQHEDHALLYPLNGGSWAAQVEQLGEHLKHRRLLSEADAPPFHPRSESVVSLLNLAKESPRAIQPT